MFAIGDTAKYQNAKCGGNFSKKICKKKLVQWVRHAYGMPRVLGSNPASDKDSAFPDWTKAKLTPFFIRVITFYPLPILSKYFAIFHCPYLPKFLPKIQVNRFLSEVHYCVCVILPVCMIFLRRFSFASLQQVLTKHKVSKNAGSLLWP